MKPVFYGRRDPEPPKKKGILKKSVHFTETTNSRNYQNTGKKKKQTNSQEKLSKKFSCFCIFPKNFFFFFHLSFLLTLPFRKKLFFTLRSPRMGRCSNTSLPTTRPLYNSTRWSNTRFVQIHEHLQFQRGDHGSRKLWTN